MEVLPQADYAGPSSAYHPIRARLAGQWEAGLKHISITWMFRWRHMCMMKPYIVLVRFAGCTYLSHIFLVNNTVLALAYATVTYTWAQCMNQFSHFSNVHLVYPQQRHKELMHMLSMCIRNSCVHIAYTSGTHACTEHTHQELRCALSILRIRNWCEQWAYASGGYLCVHW